MDEAMLDGFMFADVGEFDPDDEDHGWRKT